MKIALVYFTFSLDEELLNLSLLRSKTLGHDVYIIDDKNSPIKNHNDWCHYVQTTSNRNSNLRGFKWIKEEIMVLHKICIDGQYDFIVKVDSDTIINSLSFIDKNFDFFTITEEDGYEGLYGATMPLSKHLIGTLYNVVSDSKKYLITQLYYKGIGDDAFFNHIAKINGLKGKHIGKRGNEFSFCYDDTVPNESSYAIDFKKLTWYSSPNELQKNREEAKKRMERYLKINNIK